jgi:hypothetical protein
MKNMKTKLIATLMALGMVLTAFSMFAAAGTPETILARVGPNVDGTRADTGASAANGIGYMWEQGEPFVLTTSVATFGVNSKGIPVDAVGTWLYNALYTQLSGDAGSVWDAWATGEDFVMVYEVFNDQSTTGRNYTCIFEDQMEGDGGTNAGNVGPMTTLTPIEDPILFSSDVPTTTAVIQIADQTTGYENVASWDGYGVYKSTTGPITQGNQGVYLGDATFGAGVWTYTDAAWNADSYYAVKVKWDGTSTGPFVAPLYSYGMSNDVFAQFAVMANTNAVTSGGAEAGALLAGNHNTPTLTITASVSDVANEGDNIVGAEISIDGGAWTAMSGTFGTPTVAVSYVFTPAPGYYATGVHNYQIRGDDGQGGALQVYSDSFTIVDTTVPTTLWNNQPSATIYTTQPANFAIGYEDFTAYNTNIVNTYITWQVNGGGYTNYALVNFSFAWGSFSNILTYSIPGMTFTAGDVIDYDAQVTDGNGNVGLLAAGSFNVADAPPGVQDPYPVYGFLQLYNGVGGVYTPLTSAGGPVVTATWISNFDGSTLTRTDVTNALGQFSIDLLNYTDGANVWLTATFEAPYGNNGYNYTTIDIVGAPGGIAQNVLCGIPYEFVITAPAPASIQNPGVPFAATYVVYDVDGTVAQGYYTFADGPAIWTSGDTLFVPPAAATFDGVVDAGTATVALTLFTGGNQWINISETTCDFYPTPWDNIQYMSAFGVFSDNWFDDYDNITVFVAVGGFAWNIVVGWNMVSVPQDVVEKGVSGTFDAYDALNFYCDWQLPGFTQLSLADRTGGNPSTYNMFDYGMAEGVAFAMDGVHAYWVYCDVAGIVQFNATNYSGIGDNVLNAAAGWNLVGFTHNYVPWTAMPTASDFTDGTVDATLLASDKVVVTEWDYTTQWYNSYVDITTFPGMATHNWVWDNSYAAQPGNGCFLWLEAATVITFNVNF